MSSTPHRKYGRDLRMAGGFNKCVLAQGKAAIDAELTRIMPLIEQGGYIPTIDHSIPPDVSYENFTYTTGNRKKSGSALTVDLPLRRTGGRMATADDRIKAIGSIILNISLYPSIFLLAMWMEYREALVLLPFRLPG